MLVQQGSHHQPCGGGKGGAVLVEQWQLYEQGCSILPKLLSRYELHSERQQRCVYELSLLLRHALATILATPAHGRALL